jgi:hypothetical protein
MKLCCCNTHFSVQVVVHYVGGFMFSFQACVVTDFFFASDVVTDLIRCFLHSMLSTRAINLFFFGQPCYACIHRPNRGLLSFGFLYCIIFLWLAHFPSIIHAWIMIELNLLCFCLLRLGGPIFFQFHGTSFMEDFKEKVRVKREKK